MKDTAGEAGAARALAARYRCDFVDLRVERIDHDLFHSIPVDLMFRYNFVPIQAYNGNLDIALADPRNLNLIDELAMLLQKKLQVKVATLSQISDLLKKTEQSQRVLDEVTEGFTLDVVGDEDNPDETLSIDKLAAGDTDIAPVIKLVDTTIFNALERRASDIHIETRDQEVAIKYRIDGVLHYAMPPIAKDWHSTIISRIKVMSELDIAERRVPQDGRFRVRYKTRLIDFRVSIMPTIHGEDAVLRVLDKESMSEKFAKLSLDVVGFAENDLVKFRRYIKEPYGMVLVTGPTGSGKTTTLYAALSEIKNDEDKIITIEDPVEYQIKGITQIPVNEKKGLTFARGLRSILRHDPDKIHGGRNSRPGNGADRHQRRAHRAPGVHHRPRQQRAGRARPLPEHGRRALQFRLGAQLHSRPAAGARHLRALQAGGPVSARVSRRERHRSGQIPRLSVLRRRGVFRMRRHGLPRTHGDSRAAGSERKDPRDDSRQAAGVGDQARGQGRQDDVSARIGDGEGVLRRHHAERDQQGDVH